MNVPHPPDIEIQARIVAAVPSAYHPEVVEAAERVIARNTEARLIEEGKVIRLDAWQTYLLEDR